MQLRNVAVPDDCIDHLVQRSDAGGVVVEEKDHDDDGNVAAAVADMDNVRIDGRVKVTKDMMGLQADSILHYGAVGH